MTVFFEREIPQEGHFLTDGPLCWSWEIDENRSLENHLHCKILASCMLSALWYGSDSFLCDVSHAIFDLYLRL